MGNVLKNEFESCKFCKCEILLDKEEIALGKFICPTCGRENIFNLKEKIDITNRRIPFISGFLSLVFPGLGFIYCGELKKGILIYIFTYILSILLLFSGMYFSLAFLILLLFIYIAIIYNSVNSAKRKLEYEFKKYNKWYVYISLIVLNIYLLNPLIKSTFIDSYSLPTSSMENAIFPGDYILVSKINFGIQLPYLKSYLLRYNKPNYNDLIVYELPLISVYGKFIGYAKYIKRCSALPGDTLKIENQTVYLNGKAQTPPYTLKFISSVERSGLPNPKIFPNGSDWNEDNYGPVRIPKSGDIVIIDSSNYSMWENVVKNEGHSIRISDDNKIYIDDKELKDNKYKIQKDYIFVLGDNRNNSLDSRFTGFVSLDEVVGKVYSVYFSLDKEVSLFNIYEFVNSIRWDRINLRLK